MGSKAAMKPVSELVPGVARILDKEGKCNEVGGGAEWGWDFITDPNFHVGPLSLTQRSLPLRQLNNQCRGE